MRAERRSPPTQALSDSHAPTLEAGLEIAIGAGGGQERPQRYLQRKPLIVEVRKLTATYDLSIGGGYDRR
jgi:hypothetical protein